MIAYARINQPRNMDIMSMFTNLPSDIQTFLCTGQTDLRKSIDGLSSIVDIEFGLNPLSKSMYLFCGHKSTVLKALYYDGFAFVMLVIRSDETRFIWPRKDREMWKISRMTLINLFEGHKIGKEDALRVFPTLESN